ncbi:UDP-N-acetylmuramoyl-L-alanyl-D-glutamate--2,6-diaminopimelate ligase [Patescibacteria group bacterium]
MKKFIPQQLKNIYHLSWAILANLIFFFPSRKIKVIGITGTDGKTTTVQMISKILEEAGKKVSVASTINFKVGEREWVNKTKFTTLSAWNVQKFISEAVGEGCEYLILETSSHSLDQFRVCGVDYDIAVITNVTREHLDYHKTMERYRKAKKKLFHKARKIVVNLDMDNPEEFLGVENEESYAYSVDSSKLEANILNEEIDFVLARNINLDIDGSSFVVNGVDFKLKIPGSFNIENSLAAISVALIERVNLETCSRALAKIKKIPGRMDLIKNDRGIDIIVDYAVTPKALEELYKLVEKIKSKRDKSRIISVFGSCGDRDRGKRPIMGEVVSIVADYVIITNEDPYSEDPHQIINEVAEGVKNKKEGENFFKILDRKEAIKKALHIAEPGDIVLVTGKGAEEIMLVGKNRIPWNDEKVILEELENIS